MIRYLHEEGCPADPVSAAEIAVRMDHVEAVSYIGRVFGNDVFPPDLFEFAVTNGKLNTMIWCFETNHPTCVRHPRHCSICVRRGYLENLVWLKENGWPWVKRACLAAAERFQHEDIAKYVRTYKKGR
jgi:hypothetical protein